MTEEEKIEEENVEKVVEEAIEKVEEVEEVVEEDFREKYLRVLAEQENTRKRLLKERNQLTQYAREGVILDFLTPIDHLESALRAAENMSEEVKHWAYGFEMILSQFKDVLATNGITPIESIGKNFDPHWHEVIETEETEEHPPGVVLKETLRGYKKGDHPLRAARVIVSKEKENNNDKEN